MSRWLNENLNLAIISLLLGFFFWAIATEAEDPTIEDVYPQLLPVAIVGLPDQWVAYGADRAHVRVTVRAPKSVWQTLQADDFHAELDLTHVSTGTVREPVRVTLDKTPSEIVSVVPKEVTLHVEPLAEKEVPVVVRQIGTPAIGYRADLSIVVPRMVQVQGPASLVTQVVRTEVMVNVQDKWEDVQVDDHPIPVNEDGEQVPHVDVIPDTVTVRAHIQEPGYLRNLPVNITLEGNPAPGYRIANLSVSPEIVTVFGSTDAVQNAPRFLQTQPISLTGATESLTTSLALQMPDGLYVVQPPTPFVTVSVAIAPIQSSLTLEITPTIQGLSQNLTATVEIDSIVVLLSGPLPIMENLTDKDVRLKLDMTNLQPGEYSLQPTVVVSDSITIENLIPESIPVKIELLPQREERP